jgi:hypothetical protein
MVSAEYHAMSLLYSVKPDMVVEPVARGAYTGEPDTYFYLCRFHEFLQETIKDDNIGEERQVNQIPPLSEFPELVADLHRRGTSKTGEFGFPITTYGGRNPQMFPLCETWEECFSRGLESIFDMEEQVQGPDKEMQQLRKGLFTKVIPRLLRPLETEGKTVTPTLVHGDMWDGNVGVDTTTRRPLIFDATPLYAHHECEYPVSAPSTLTLGLTAQLADELGPWWPTRHRVARDYVTAYRTLHDKNHSDQDFESRVALYAM